MRLEKLTFRGITRFSNTVEIDFASIPSGLVAIQGGNGSGKTTTMEAIHAALYREFPSRGGNLAEHCNGRDAFIDLLFSWGGNYRSLVKIDAEKKTQEAYLYQGGDAIVSGKVRDFDAKVSDLFVSRSVFLASALSAQNKAGNFIDLPKGEKKDFFARMLGLELYQRMAEISKDKANESEKLAVASEQSFRDREVRVAELPALQERLLEVESAIIEQNDIKAKYTERHEHSISEEARVENAARRRSEITSQISEIQHEIHVIEAKIAKNDEAAANNRRVLENAEAIKKAMFDVDVLSADIEGKKFEIAEIEKERESFDVSMDNARTIQANADRLESEAREMEQVFEKEKADRLARLEKQLSDLNLTMTAKIGELNRAKSVLSSMESLVDSLRKTSEKAKRATCGDAIMSCEMAQDVAASINNLPANEKKIEEKKAEIKNILAELEEHRIERDRIEVVKSDVSALKPEQGGAAHSKREDAVAQRKAAEEIEKEAQASKLKISNLLGINRSRLSEMENDIATKRKIASEFPRIETAERRLEELAEERKAHEEEKASKETRLSGLKEELSSLPDPMDKLSILAAKKQAEEMIAMAESEIAKLVGENGGLTSRISELSEIRDLLEKERPAIEKIRNSISDWQHLAQAYGPNGVQALKIDAAGPEVSSIVNDLLFECFGDRFSVSIQTMRPKADGKGYVETFDLQVLDNERQREGALLTLSGGEKVIVNEAVGLGLAIFNARRSGKKIETLLRDETSGALDPVNAERYVHMLRKALHLGGFHHVIYIAHQPEVWEAADTVIKVRDGEIEVDRA